jgi:DNA-binding NtrC family response regulator
MTTILLVDDDPFQASLMLSLLGQRFGDVRRANDAAEALCLIEEPQFAASLGLVISGHHLQRIGGPEFVSELHTRMPDLPVLVLETAGETPADYGQSSVSFLAKPYTNERLIKATSRMLSTPKAAVA